MLLFSKIPYFVVFQRVDACEIATAGVDLRNDKIRTSFEINENIVFFFETANFY
jgi:hypothetical protein